MFHKLIAAKRDQWIAQKDCPVKGTIAYIEKQGYMRDAQIEAIKTYLFLKIECDNRPLYKLFSEGKFNLLNTDELELTPRARNILLSNPAAASLMQYALSCDRKGKQLSPELERFIKNNAENIDYEKAFFDLFYKTSYTDYLFSLPMGAGKTYLMAAFIYLDLYYAQVAPENKAFARNFIIFAPSGLKSSIVPSLKTIERFNPAWIIPEPAASGLKRLVKFEILDEARGKKGANRVKNPNAQKINAHQPQEDLIGLVAIANAEKVILDRLPSDPLNIGQNDTQDERDRLANELRNIIGKIPNLAVYIDEVHHAMDDDIKLRQVVTKWTQNSAFNSVIGFSGTPYLEKAESVQIADRFLIKNSELANVVYYYPLIDGIGNFLKTPTVESSTNDDVAAIVESGIKNFLDAYKDTIYGDNTVAKLAIYCGSIENLEEEIYPIAARIVAEYGLNPSETILKHHKGNKNYKIIKDAETEFASLDLPISKKRIILLVQIGKEGWDCRSLTGVILSQKGDCPTNMVLQTACRCLRQVDKNSQETALIWLNKFNHATLRQQLQIQQDTDINAFTRAKGKELFAINRYSRVDHLKLPPVEFYQLEIEYAEYISKKADTPIDIKNAANKAKTEHLKESYTLGNERDKRIEKEGERGDENADFDRWLYAIAKESFGFITISDLRKHSNELNYIFEHISYEKDRARFFSSFYDQETVRTNIRKAFYDKRDINYRAFTVPNSALLLKIKNFTSPIFTDKPNQYEPSQTEVEKIISADNGKPIKASASVNAAIETLIKEGETSAAESLRKKYAENKRRDFSYHYLPYHFASAFEKEFFDMVFALKPFTDKELQIYYNGDRELTEFKIRCYKQSGASLRYIGNYTPDFLIIKRKKDEIDKVIIVETKGEAFVDRFSEKKDFMRSLFMEHNENKFGYKRFDFLYLEDSLSPQNKQMKTIDAIEKFFKD
ncbi:MAG: DEAD/DEAH box helicase family protein [Helicobacteraceae bacterium]|jgi:superfamily II DNA or RNA helicase|nr:DEAD/DEAH box helicase family protein [Helicobacteraceae bacterium]